MKYMDQVRPDPGHKSTPRWQSPGLSWFPVDNEKSFSSEKSLTPSTTEATENSWNARPAAFSSVTEPNKGENHVSTSLAPFTFSIFMDNKLNVSQTVVVMRRRKK